MSDDELPEYFKSALEDNIKETMEDFLKTYEKLKEHFEYKNPVINSALMDVSSLMSYKTIDGFLNTYLVLEEKIPKTRDLLKEAAKIRAAANIYASSFGKTMYEVTTGQSTMLILGDPIDSDNNSGNGEIN